MTDYTLGACPNCEPENNIKCYECYILSGDEDRDLAALKRQQKIQADWCLIEV